MKNKMIIVTLFAIAMACLESAVVVYLRALYYPKGFTIQYINIDVSILITEIVREIATIVMLYTLSALISKKLHQQFAWFIFAFAVWDIFYYVWLKIFIHWPVSIMEWDILFLLPITWLGPVLAPVICSIAMIILAFVILIFKSKPSITEWLGLCLGSMFILYTFMYDYGKLLNNNHLWNELNSLTSNPIFIQKASQLVPEPFQWIWFSCGMGLILTAILSQLKRNLQQNKHEN